MALLGGVAELFQPLNWFGPPKVDRQWRKQASQSGKALPRRELLRFLAASPLLAQAWAQDAPATGVDDDVKPRINREAFGHYQIRARRLVDVSEANLKTDVFGATWDTPIYISAVGSQKTFHPEGELAVARAARAKKTMQMLSTVTRRQWKRSPKAWGRRQWFQA